MNQSEYIRKKADKLLLEDFLLINYSRMWKILYLDEEFVRGLMEGLMLDHLPKLIENIIEWFNKYTDFMGYKFVIPHDQ